MNDTKRYINPISGKYVIPLEDIGAIAEGGRDSVITLLAEGVRNKTPIEQETTADWVNGIPREVVCELFQSGTLKLAGASLLNPARAEFFERHQLKEEDVRFDPEFEKHKAERAAAATQPAPTIISPGQPNLSPEALLERFLLREKDGKSGGGIIH